MTTAATIADYAAGDLTPVQALRALCRDLGEVESQLTPLEHERAGLRNAISEILTRLDGERAIVPGFGKVALTQPSVVERWDGARIAAFAEYLAATGQDELADSLSMCCVRSMRAGGLRIERERTAAD